MCQWNAIHRLVCMKPVHFTLPPQTWLEAFKLLPETNGATVVVSIITIILLILMKIASKWLQKKTVPIPVYSRRGRGWKVKRVKWSIPLPSQLIVVRAGHLYIYMYHKVYKYLCLLCSLRLLSSLTVLASVSLQSRSF